MKSWSLIATGAVVVAIAAGGCSGPSQTTVAPAKVLSAQATTPTSAVNGPPIAVTHSDGRRTSSTSDVTVTVLAGGTVTQQWTNACQNCNGYYISWSSSSASGFSTSFNPSSTAPDGTTTETITVSSSVATGSYTLTTYDPACQAGVVPPNCLSGSATLTVIVTGAPTPTPAPTHLPTPAPTPTPSGPSWHATGGFASDVGANDSVAWAVPSDGSLWYLNATPGSAWTKTNGASATKVEVSPLGTAWAVLSDETIWHFTSGFWQKLGCCGVDLGVGPNDDPWIIGADGLTPFHYVNGNWQQLPGQFTRITVSPEGVAYAVSPGDRKIWTYSPTSNSWTTFACCANDIGVGSNQNVWVIGDGNTVWHWNGSSFTLMPGSGTSIAVTPSGVPWVTVPGTNAVEYYQ